MSPPSPSPRPGSVSDRAWQEFLSQLDRWIAEHGHARVPQRVVVDVDTPTPYPLGERVAAWRRMRQRGKLDPARARELERRSGWSWSGRSAWRAAAWQAHLDTLRARVRDYGSLDGLELHDPVTARWLRERRVDETLTTDQRAELEQIPGALVDRKVRTGEYLERMSQWLQEDEERSAGQVSRTTRHGPDRYPLGPRTYYWRSRYAQGRLAPDDVARFESLRGWSWESTLRRQRVPAVDPAAGENDGPKEQLQPGSSLREVSQ